MPKPNQSFAFYGIKRLRSVPLPDQLIAFGNITRLATSNQVASNSQASFAGWNNVIKGWRITDFLMTVSALPAPGF
jgi:hypothetical protein